MQTDTTSKRSVAKYICINKAMRSRLNSVLQQDDRNYIQAYVNVLQNSDIPETFKYELRQLANRLGIEIELPLADQAKNLHMGDDIRTIISLNDPVSRGVSRVNLFEAMNELLNRRTTHKAILNPRELSVVQYVLGYIEFTGKIDEGVRKKLEIKIGTLQAINNRAQTNPVEHKVLVVQRPIEIVEPPKVEPIEEKINIEQELKRLKTARPILGSFEGFLNKISSNKQAITDDERAMITNDIDALMAISKYYSSAIKKMHQTLATIPKAATPTTAAPVLTTLSQEELPIAQDVQSVTSGSNEYIVENLMPLLYSGRQKFNASELKIVKDKINNAVKDGDMDLSVAEWLREELDKFQGQ